MRIELNIQSQYEVDENSMKVSQLLDDLEFAGLCPMQTHAVIENVESSWADVLTKLIQALEKHYGYEFQAEKLHKVVTDYVGV